MRKTSKGYRYQPTLGGKRLDIVLPLDTAPDVVVNFENSFKLLRAHRDGALLTTPDRERIEVLPKGLRKILIENGLIVGKPEEVDVPTVQSLVARYRAGRHDVSELTIVSEKVKLDNFLEYFKPSTRVNDITNDMCGGYRPWLRDVKRLAPTTANRRVSTAKTLLDKKAVEWGYISKPLFTGIRTGSTANPDRQDFITPERLQKVVDACDHPEQKAVLAFAYYAALRIPTEIRHMKFSDFKSVSVNGKEYQLLIVAEKSKGTKTGSRPILVHPQL